MVECGRCKNKISKDDEGHKIISETMKGLWKGKSWRLYLCDKCNVEFDKEVGFNQ